MGGKRLDDSKSTDAQAKRSPHTIRFQVEDDAGLAEITRALTEAEQAIFAEQENLCCYAKGNKTWASDPDGVVWEAFHRLGLSETMGRDEARDSQIEDLHERAVI